MKKIEKFVLNENAEILNKEEMKLLLGGGIYGCTCFEEGFNESGVYYTECGYYRIEATNFGGALDIADELCNGDNRDHICQHFMS